MGTQGPLPSVGQTKERLVRDPSGLDKTQPSLLPSLCRPGHPVGVIQFAQARLTFQSCPLPNVLTSPPELPRFGQEPHLASFTASKFPRKSAAFMGDC